MRKLKMITCLEGRTDSDEERRKITEDATERYQYLRKSGKTLPLLKFFNDDYVYIFLAKAVRGYGSHYIYNRKKNEGFLLKEGKPFFMYPCFGIMYYLLFANRMSCLNIWIVI